MKGKLVSQSGEGGSIVYTRDDNGKQETKNLGGTVNVTLNGDQSSLGALKAGDKLTLSGDPVTGIDATR